MYVENVAYKFKVRCVIATRWSSYLRYDVNTYATFNKSIIF